MIWMDVDAALSEVPVNSVPLIDNADFKTIKSAVAYNAAGMALYWHFVTAAGAYSVTAVTPTTGGNYDWAHQNGGMYSIEIPASGGASINNDTEGFGWFTGVCDGVLPWRGPTIGFRAAGLNDAMVESAWSATRGLAGTALPNAAAEASGGLATLSAAQASNGTIQANVHRWLTGTPNALQSGRVDSYLGAVAAGVIAAASFAAGAFDAVWTVAVRILTAATNITSDGAAAPSSTDYTAVRAAKLDNLDAAVSSRGTGTALDAAGVRSAVGLASANLDTQLAALAAYIDTEVASILAAVDTEVAAIKAKTDTLPASPAASGEAETALATTARSELGAVPAANASLAAKLEYVFMLARNGGTQTATARTARNDAGATIATQAVSDNGTTLTVGKAT